MLSFLFGGMSYSTASKIVKHFERKIKTDKELLCHMSRADPYILFKKDGKNAIMGKTNEKDDHEWQPMGFL